MGAELEKMVYCLHLCSHQWAQATHSVYPVCPQSPAIQRSLLLLVPGPYQSLFHLEYVVTGQFSSVIPRHSVDLQTLEMKPKN